MGRILYSGTFGSDDPTRATLPFLAASGALDEGHEAVIFVTGEAVYLMKDEIASAVQGFGVGFLWVPITLVLFSNFDPIVICH